tara:strand:+ start:2183 stop:3388 length:1206 start_codon:yes stop_codon:yes gene_type:complete
MREIYRLNIHIAEDSLYMDEHGNYLVHSNHVQFGKQGYWLGRSDGWSMNNNDLVNLGLDSLLTIDSNDIKEKSFYRYPELNLPRQKMDLLKDKYNIKVTRSKDKADYHIMSVKLIDKIVEYSWNRHVNFTAVYHMFKTLKERNLLHDSCLNTFRKIIETVPRDCMVHLTFNHQYYHHYNSSTKDPKREAFLEEVDKLISEYSNDRMHNGGRDMIIGNNTAASRADDVEKFTSLMEQKDKLVLDTTMIEIIDEGLAVIDNDEYDRVEQMIKSGDRDNRTLAVEMLANCNVNKSFDVVSGIYYWNYDWFKDSSNWNTVNVKSFRAQMKKYEGGASRASIHCYNKYLQILVEDGKLTKFAVDRTRKAVLDEFLSSMIGPEADVFKVDLEHLKIKEEYKKQILDD